MEELLVNRGFRSGGLLYVRSHNAAEEVFDFERIKKEKIPANCGVEISFIWLK
jgi:hypothetical protein